MNPNNPNLLKSPNRKSTPPNQPNMQYNTNNKEEIDHEQSPHPGMMNYNPNYNNQMNYNFNMQQRHVNDMMSRQGPPPHIMQQQSQQNIQGFRPPSNMMVPPHVRAGNVNVGMGPPMQPGPININNMGMNNNNNNNNNNNINNNNSSSSNLRSSLNSTPIVSLSPQPPQQQSQQQQQQQQQSQQQSLSRSMPNTPTTTTTTSNSPNTQQYQQRINENIVNRGIQSMLPQQFNIQKQQQQSQQQNFNYNIGDSDGDFPALGKSKNAKNEDNGLIQNLGFDNSHEEYQRKDYNIVDKDNGKYGLMGLLSVIKNTDIDATMLSIGIDLTGLGLNLNSPGELYESFGSPWLEYPTQRKSEYYIPLCYSTPNLESPTFKMSLFTYETLFYIFYSMPKDLLQLHAAIELYDRNWKYHKEGKIWLTKVQGTESTINSTYEMGSFFFFDVVAWATVRRDSFYLPHDALETKESLIAQVNKAEQQLLSLQQQAAAAAAAAAQQQQNGQPSPQPSPTQSPSPQQQTSPQ